MPWKLIATSPFQVFIQNSVWHFVILQLPNTEKDAK